MSDERQRYQRRRARRVTVGGREGPPARALPGAPAFAARESPAAASPGDGAGSWAAWGGGTRTRWRMRARPASGDGGAALLGCRKPTGLEPETADPTTSLPLLSVEFHAGNEKVGAAFAAPCPHHGPARRARRGGKDDASKDTPPETGFHRTVAVPHHGARPSGGGAFPCR